jgi:hypothetical protein
MTKRRISFHFILFAVNHIGLRIVPFNNHSKDVIVSHKRNGTVCLMNVPSQHVWKWLLFKVMNAFNFLFFFLISVDILSSVKTDKFIFEIWILVKESNHQVKICPVIVLNHVMIVEIKLLVSHKRNFFFLHLKIHWLIRNS